MDVPGSSNQRDCLRPSSSAPPSSPEMKSRLGKLRDRLLNSRRVDSESARLQESFSNVEMDMTSIYRALEQCLVGESSSGKAPEKCIEDKIDLNTPITECSEMLGQYRKLGKEVNRAANTRNEEKRMYEDLLEEEFFGVEILPTSQDQGGTQDAKCLRKTIQELEEEASNSLLLLVEKIIEIIEKRKALEEELRALEESDHR